MIQELLAAHEKLILARMRFRAKHPMMQGAPLQSCYVKDTELMKAQQEFNMWNSRCIYFEAACLPSICIREKKNERGPEITFSNSSGSAEEFLDMCRGA